MSSQLGSVQGLSACGAPSRACLSPRPPAGSILRDSTEGAPGDRRTRRSSGLEGRAGGAQRPQGVGLAWATL